MRPVSPMWRTTSAERPTSTGTDSGRDELFAALLSRHHLALMGYLLSLVPNWSDAEDLLQQSSVVMWRKFAEFEPDSDFLRWGCQIARFEAMNYLRKRGRDRHVFSSELLEQLAQEGATEGEQIASQRIALEGCLKKLDPRHRKLLGWCYQPKSTVKEIAERLGRTPNSIYKTLNRLRAVLLRCVRNSLAQEDA